MAEDPDERRLRLNEELDPRARRQKVWFTFQFLGSCAVAAVLCFVAVNKLADGQDVAMWSTVLIVVPLIIVAWGLFLRWGIKNRRL